MLRKTQILAGLAGAFCALLLASGAAAARTSSTALDLLRAVNATRTAHGLRPVALDPVLERAARAHTLEMLQSGSFSHGDFAGRMLRFHVRAPYAAENLAWGTGIDGTSATVVAEWLRSPEHRANLLRPTFTRIGIGAAQGSFLGNGGATVLTADFAGH